MLWLFRRNGEDCPVETSFDNSAQEYVLVICKGFPSERWERFTDESAFRSRLEKLEDEMSADRWERQGPPVLSTDGWKL